MGVVPCGRPLLSGPRVWPRLSVMLRAGEKAWATSASSLLPRIWPTVRGWRARRKGFVSPDNVGKRRPSRPDRFQGFRLSLPGNGREGLRDSGRGGGRVRVRACARMCARVSRNAQVTPATRQRSPYFLRLPSEGHRLLREEIDHNSESPSARLYVPRAHIIHFQKAILLDCLCLVVFLNEAL